MITQEPRGEVRGRIVNLSSQHGFIAAPDDVAYGTTKAAVAYLEKFMEKVEGTAKGKIVLATVKGDVHDD